MIKGYSLLLKVLFAFLLFFSCSTSSDTNSKWERIESLSDLQLHNLQALSKLYGCARYFYPNQMTSRWDNIEWYKFLTISIEKVLEAQNDEELKMILLEIYSPIIPELTFDKPFQEDRRDKKTMFYVKEHYGFGERPIEDIFESKIKVFDEYADYLPVPDSLYQVALSDHLFAYYPIAVSYKHRPTKSLLTIEKEIKNKTFSLLDISEVEYIWREITNRVRTKEYNFIRDPYVRWADIICKWNVIRHFYPYYEEDGLDDIWENVLNDAFIAAASCNNTIEYYNVVRCLLGHINDSHITLNRFVTVTNFLTVGLPCFVSDLKVEWIGESIYLDEVPDTLQNILSRGDLLIAINHVPIDSVIEEKWSLISASTRQGKFESLIRGILLESFKLNDTLQVTFLNNQMDTITVPVIPDKQIEFALSDKHYQPEFIKEVEDSLYYINLTKAGQGNTYEVFKEKIGDLKQAKGIILDIRGYPDYNVANEIITHFKKDSIKWGDFRRPTQYFPFQKDVVYEKTIAHLEISSDFIDVPVCVLINHKAMSYAETLIGLIKENNIGSLIGQPTIGTNGDITVLRFPIFGMTMTAIKDFSGYHGKGIEPDILVEPTLEGIRANRDEILEAAIQYILSQA